MSRVPPGNRPQPKDMYWFAHGGLESSGDKSVLQRSSGDTEEENSDSSWKSLPERRLPPDDNKAAMSSKDAADGTISSSPLLSLERDDRPRTSDKRLAVEERKKQLWEAEQERHDAVLKKHLEREAALEARRNAQRSHISFAFGSSVPRNVDSLQGGEPDKTSRHSPASGVTQKEEYHEICPERRSVSPLNNTSFEGEGSRSSVYWEQMSVCAPSWLVGSGALIGDDMSRSMSSSVAPRGRRKNDLMPTVPYERNPAPAKGATQPTTTRKRSVSMTRLDQLARPRRHYVEATKANSTANGVQNGNAKDIVRSPTRPLSSASEQSGGSGRAAVQRLRSSPRKPRPMSIAGTVPEQAHKRNITPIKKVAESLKKVIPTTIKLSLSKPSEKSKTSDKPKFVEKSKPNSAEKSKLYPVSTSTPKPIKQVATKPIASVKVSSPKTASGKKSATNKKKDDMLVSVPPELDVGTGQTSDLVKASSSRSSSPTAENVIAENEKNNAKKIISEEEAKAALAEKRRVAREQAEKEAEVERQRQEELRLAEEERQRQEEERQKVMEEEQLQLLEEHRKQEEEKLRRAIEEQAKKEEEEKARREEEMRLKVEQEKKSQEEAEKQRIELEEKLRKEEEERAERKKRLEKIMSRTRGKASGTSPSGSMSSGDQHDQQEGFSSGANSLDSNETGDLQSDPNSIEDSKAQTELLSDGNSLEINPTFEVASESESLNSNDLMMPISETASCDSSLVLVPDKDNISLSADPSVNIVEAAALLKEQADAVCEPLVHENVVSEKQEGLLTSEGMKSSEGVEINTNEHYDLLSTSAICENQNLISAENEKLHAENEKNMKAFEDETQYPLEQLKTVDQQFFGDIFNSSKQFNETVHVAEVTPLSHPIKNEFELFSSDVASHPTDFATNKNEQVEKLREELKQEFELYGSMISNSESVQEELLQPVESFPLNKSVDAVGVLDLPAANEEAENFSHYSTSSDMKLPDPIYETSEDGSISSEKHQDFRSYAFQENSFSGPVEELVPASDDVFNGSEDRYTTSHLESNPFAAEVSHPSEEPASAYERQFQVGFSQDHSSDHNEDDFQKYDPSHSTVEDHVKQEAGQNLVLDDKNDTFFLQDSNGENIEQDINPNMMNPFSTSESNFNECMYPEKEAMQLGTESNITDSNVYYDEVGSDRFAAAGDNPFLDVSYPSNQIHAQECGDFHVTQQHAFVSSEQISNFESQTFANEPFSSKVEFDDVTIVKAEGGDGCIGIISSVDHDQMLNDFPKPNFLSEQLKSNLEYRSITDSEDSSLDSNLSQVLTVEDTEGLNHITESNSVSQSELISKVEHTYNGDSISKSNGNHFPVAEVYSNGHRLESPDGFLPTVPLDGSHLSPVDPPKSNRFEGVDAVGFLEKGAPNPFLVQDEQKKVLLTQDFFN